MKILILIIALSIIALFITIKKSNTQKYVWDTTPGGSFSLIITEHEIACEHPERERESVPWDEITEIMLVTTDEGPFLPDMWFVFMGKSKGCSVPSEAKGIDLLWDEIKKRFNNFNYDAVIQAGTDNDQKILWKKDITAA